MSSILNDVKKLIGLTEEYKVFDTDIILHTNSVLSVLNQLGVGPEEGFFISDESQDWKDFIQDEKLLNCVKTYVFLQVKTLFDPPASGTVSEQMKTKSAELEWRICAIVDHINREGGI